MAAGHVRAQHRPAQSTIAPQPETSLQAGDVVVAVVPVEAEAELCSRLNGRTDE
jgi:K+/H+ antiporter YhaU regulatory subunit KhtT